MSESKLDRIAEYFSIQHELEFKAQVKGLFKEVVGEALVERRHNPLSGENIDLVDRAELLKAIEEL